MDQSEVFSIVLQVAAHAVFTVRVLHFQARVVAMICSKTLRYLFVAIEALKGRHAGAKLVTTRALRGTGQRLMSFGKGARRDLGMSRSREKGYGQSKPTECDEQ